MVNFVLVHGAMHGGWCWKNVRSILAKAGYSVLTPTLTGQGERRRELSRQVGVETHIEDVLETLWFEDIDEVHLVLHSYAGILAGPIAERAIGRLSSITFLGAFLVRPGECLLDVEPPDVAARYRQLATEKGDGWRLPATSDFLEQWGITDSALREAVGNRLTDFALACQTQPVVYDPASLDTVRKIYVRHTAPQMASLHRFWERAVSSGWQTEEIATGHDMMLQDPQSTVDLLMQIAE